MKHKCACAVLSLAAACTDAGARLVDTSPSGRDAGSSDAAVIPTLDAATSPDDAGDPADARSPRDAGPEPFRCTRVVGFSQTNQWFSDFESGVEGTRWELMWTMGATLDVYRDRSASAWTAPVQSRCGAPVDRLVLNVAAPYAEDAAAWDAALRETLDSARHHFPAARSIVLQPVVGGPMRSTCTVEGVVIAASSQQPHVDEAILRAAGDDVAAGPSPEVRSCEDYADAIGHLTGAGGRAAGMTIAEHYRSID